ncbi:MAG: MauE/DoxX family redox-associated membrane protein, partial [Nocardioidaceae bacterium]
TFARDLADYQLLPIGVVGLAASLLPWLEIALGLWLLVNFAALAALGVAAALLLAFAVGMAVNLARGRRIRCGCRAKDRHISWRLVTGNTVLAACALACITIGPVPATRVWTSPSPSLKSVPPIAVLICVAVGSCVVEQIRLLLAIRQALPPRERSGFGA